MQESTTLLDLSGSGLLQLERDRVKAQEKIQNIYDKKTNQKSKIGYNSITKTEFLPTIYDVPAPPSFMKDRIIEGMDNPADKGKESTKKGQAKADETKDKIDSKMNMFSSKGTGMMQKLSDKAKRSFLSFSKTITTYDRGQILSAVKSSIEEQSKQVTDPSKIIPNEASKKNNDTDPNAETNNKTKKEREAEPTEPKTTNSEPINLFKKKENFQTIEPVVEGNQTMVDTTEAEEAKKAAEKKSKDYQRKMKSLAGVFLNQQTPLSEEEIDANNADIVYDCVYEFVLLCLSFVITYNIYYFSFIYKWDVKTAHFDPDQGFIFGGVFKSMVDDWLMRDIRYPMLFMGYLYSWLIPTFFRFIGVIRYPKLCFIIILLHTMILTFTQGANAAMSVDSLIGGNPMGLVLLLNILSCFGAFFNTSISVENALAWVRFYGMLIPSIISNCIRFLIAVIGVFISQFMVYLFFIYTTTGVGLLWESQIFGIGDTIAEINNHIDGKSKTDQNYCKDEGDSHGLWEFINKQIEPNFPYLFRILCYIFVAVKLIIVGLKFVGFSAKIWLMIFIVTIPAFILWIMDKISALINGSDKNNNTVMVSSKDSVIDQAKTFAKNMSEKRTEYLTRKSNEADQFLSKKLGQPLRNIQNKLSNNVVSRVALGDNTFTALLPEDKKELQDLTKNLNDIMTNIDFAIDKDGKQAEEDVKTLITNNESVYEIIEHILEQPKIQQHIANRIGKGKRMSEILQHMYQDILTKSGANPKVSELVSNILTYKMDYGNELKEGENDTTNSNAVVVDTAP